MIRNVDFYMMALTDITAIFIFLLVYSVLHRGKDEVFKEDKPVTKLDLWVEKIVQIATKFKLKLVFNVFFVSYALYLLNKGLYAIGTQGNVTELQYLSIINAAIIMGSMALMFPFLDKIRFFKNKRMKIKGVTTNE